MSVSELIAELTTLGVEVGQEDGRIWYRPRSAVTPALKDRMRVHRGELLAILQPEVNAPDIDPTDAVAVWQAALDKLEGDPIFPSDALDALRAADVRWGNDTQGDPWEAAIELPEACPRCGSLEMWLSVADDVFGATPGKWRCVRCDPPEAGRRLRKLVEQIRRRDSRNARTRQNNQHRV